MNTKTPVSDTRVFSERREPNTALKTLLDKSREWLCKEENARRVILKAEAHK